MKKYEMLKGNKIKVNGHTLYRIRALKNFSDVSIGDLGGCIEKEDNLSQEGDCWVYDNARVYDDARIYDNAEIYGNARICSNAEVYGNAWVYDNAEIYGNALIYDNARIYGNALIYDNAEIYGNARICGNAQINKSHQYLYIMNIGGRDDVTTFFKRKNNKIGVTCGCFTGTIDEFLKAVNETYCENKHVKAYKLACELARVQILEEK